jgi:hypothetical protein
MRRAAAAFALLSPVMLSSATQQPGRDPISQIPTGSSRIHGRVVAAASDTPLRNARVTIPRRQQPP